MYAKLLNRTFESTTNVQPDYCITHKPLPWPENLISTNPQHDTHLYLSLEQDHLL